MNRRLCTLGFLVVLGIGLATLAAAANPQILQEISAKIQPDVKSAFEKICGDLLKPELSEANLNEAALRAAIQKAFPKAIPGMNHEAGLLYLSNNLKAQIQSRLIILQKKGPGQSQAAGMIGDTGKPAPTGDATNAAGIVVIGKPAIIDDNQKKAIIDDNDKPGITKLAPGGDGSNSSIIIIYRKIIANLDAIAAKANAKAKLTFGKDTAASINGGGIK